MLELVDLGALEMRTTDLLEQEIKIYEPGLRWLPLLHVGQPTQACLAEK